MSQSEIQSAMRFLQVALEDGPRKASDVLRESRIFELPVEAVFEAGSELGMYWWLSMVASPRIMWGLEDGPIGSFRQQGK